MIQFLHPWMLWTVGLLVIPVALWRYRRQLAKKGFTAPWFFEKQATSLESKTSWRQWFQRRLFWAACAIITLFALALAGITASSEALPTERVVILFDTSASMLAVDPESKKTALAEGVEELERRLSQLPTSVAVTLVSYASELKTESLDSLSRVEVLDRLRGLEISGVESVAGASKGLLSNYLERHAGRDRVWVVTDQPQAQLADAFQDARWIQVGPKQGLNLGVTQLEVFRDPMQANASLVSFTIVGSSWNPEVVLEGKVQIWLDGRPTWVRSVSLSHGASKSFTATLDLRRARQLEVRLSRAKDDVFAADDQVLVPLPPMKILTLGWVSDRRDPSVEMALNALSESGGLRLLHYASDSVRTSDPVDLWLVEGLDPGKLAIPAKAPIWYHQPTALPIRQERATQANLDSGFLKTWAELKLNRWRFSNEGRALPGGAWMELPDSSKTMFAFQSEDGSRAFVTQVRPEQHVSWLEDPAFPRWVASVLSWTAESKLPPPVIRPKSWDPAQSDLKKRSVLSAQESVLATEVPPDRAPQVWRGWTVPGLTWSAGVLAVVLLLWVLETRWILKDER